MTGQKGPALPEWLHHGALVRDLATEREGIVHGIGSPYRLESSPSCVWLLPQGGGHEWRVDIKDVRPYVPAGGGEWER
ncbi:hypothetical protein GCM10027168_66390 [Streptomyces capparidis]